MYVTTPFYLAYPDDDWISQGSVATRLRFNWMIT